MVFRLFLFNGESWWTYAMISSLLLEGGGGLDPLASCVGFNIFFALSSLLATVELQVEFTNIELSVGAVLFKEFFITFF